MVAASHLHARRKHLPTSTGDSCESHDATSIGTQDKGHPVSPKMKLMNTLRRLPMLLTVALLSVVLSLACCHRRELSYTTVSSQPATLSMPHPSESSSPLQITRFRTNNLVNPLALPDGRPVFSWALSNLNKTTTEDHYQTAYRILVVSAFGEGQVWWDSGQVHSGETLQIEYQGELPLPSLQALQWQVQVWDERGRLGTKADADEWPRFETGPLDEASWGGARWIARHVHRPLRMAGFCELTAPNEENQAPRFRTTLLQSVSDVVQVRAHIAGLGYHQLYIDGQRVGDSLLDPGWTTYSKRVFYSSHDVTGHFLQSPEKHHAVAVELGNGWWNPLPWHLWNNSALNLRTNLVGDQNFAATPPMFRLRIVGYRSDGSLVSILATGVGQSWQTRGSPTLLNDIFWGERYDARLEPLFDGWTTAEYTADDTWRPALLANATGLGKLEAQTIPPIRRQQTLTSTLLSIREGPNETQIIVLDTGVNHAGSCRIQLHSTGHEGSLIHLMYGEILYKDGKVNGMNSVVGQIKNKDPTSPCQPEIAYQQDAVTLGSRPLDWTPSWSWHGFRYVQVTLPLSVRPEDFSMECFTMRTDLDLIANFSSSDPWLDDLRTLVRNTFDSNLMSVLSDCPHRERFGYGGDPLGAGEAGLSIYDFSTFFRKRIQDFNDAQRRSNGQLTGFTETAPFVGIADKGLGPGTGPIGWQTFQPEAQLWLYKYYGDVRTMTESFPHTKAYIDLLDTVSEGIEGGLGDWMPVDKTDVAFTGLGFQRMSYLAFANITELLGMPSDIASRYRQKAEKLAKEINSRFLVGGNTLSLFRAYFRSLLGGGRIGDYLVGVDERAGKVTHTGQVTQTGQAMALFNGYIESDQALKREVLRRLEENTLASSFMKGACQCDEKSPFQPECYNAVGGPGPHMTAGLHGVKFFLMSLADGGLNDLAYEVVTTESYPGLRWMTNNPFANATTIWESYFFSDDVYSHNHPMFGSTEVWLLQSVVGIQPHPSARGMNHILIRPNPPSQLGNARASFESPRGVVSASWEKMPNGVFELSVTIPPNCRATVHVPGSRTSRILHGGMETAGRWAPSLASPNRGSFVIETGSGHHVFRSTDLGESRTSLE